MTQPDSHKALALMDVESNVWLLTHDSVRPIDEDTHPMRSEF
jgi:hypothetical protein